MKRDSPCVTCGGVGNKMCTTCRHRLCQRRLRKLRSDAWFKLFGATRTEIRVRNQKEQPKLGLHGYLTNEEKYKRMRLRQQIAKFKVRSEGQKRRYNKG